MSELIGSQEKAVELSWAEILQGIRASWIPELVSYIGLALTLVGLAVTFIAAIAAKNAAVGAAAAAAQAEAAANSARNELLRIESFIDLSAVINAMENIKVLHREQAWGRLTDRYSDARKLLIQVRSNTARITPDQVEFIDSCISNFSALEKSLDRNINNPERIDITKANSNISNNIDRLVEMLHTLRGDG